MTAPLRLPALAGGLLLAASLACSGGSPSGQRSTTAPLLPGGTTFDVTLSAPAPDALVASPPGDVQVTGTVTLGTGVGATDTALVLALDASAGTAAEATCDGGTTLLGCEQAAAHAALAQAGAAGSVVGQVGLAIYATTGAALDLGPGAGVQKVTGPSTDADAAGGIDVDQALASITPDGKAALFSAVSVGAGPAGYGAGLNAALDALAASDRPAKVVALVATAPNAGGPDVPTLIVPAGVIVHAFAVGTTCDAASTHGTLAALAQLGAAGSSCTDVASPADLAAAIEAILAADVSQVTLSVDDGAPVALATTPGAPAQSPATLEFDTVVAGLAPGTHAICVDAKGADVGGAGTASACVNVHVATIVLAPAAQVLELGTPGQTATVTATVAAAATPMAGVPVTFTITAGPNAGKTQTVATGADGTAAFTYAALQHNAGLGTDEVEGCFTDAGGHTACADATVKWQDTTPPVMGCVAGPNPGGATVPATQAGFRTLTAVDAVDETPQVFLKDTGSGAVFGPFSSGVAVKYTQAPGAKPDSQPMGGGLLHITGTGDPAVFGVDFSKNVSALKACPPVPPGK